jgi:hypothetical protein
MSNNSKVEEAEAEDEEKNPPRKFEGQVEERMIYNGAGVAVGGMRWGRQPWPKEFGLVMPGWHGSFGRSTRQEPNFVVSEYDPIRKFEEEESGR